ncbi:MAG: hypothetical protein U0640_07575 [Phycisphaerales bacterium]
MSAKPSNRCAFCNYDLSGLGDVSQCPECGHERKDAERLVDFKLLSRFAVSAYAVSFCFASFGSALSTYNVITSYFVTPALVVVLLFYYANAGWAAYGIYALWAYRRTPKSSEEREFDVLGSLAFVQLFLLPASCCCLMLLA